jgi:hypothetical protein
MKTKFLRASSSIVGLLAVLALSASASASHKSWFLRNPGTSCQSSTSMVNNPLTYSQGAIYNYGSATSYVTCPMTLAGRFAGTNPIGVNFVMAEWASAIWGKVYVEDNSSTANVSCTAWVRSSSGGTYLSASKTSSGTGAQTLSLNAYSAGAGQYTWSGSLGTGVFTIRSLGYSCTLPGYSLVSGYDAKICQNYTNCTP